MGGWAKHALVGDPSLPAKKSASAFLQKIFGSYFVSRILNFRHGASSLRGASRRAPKSRFFGLSPTLGSSIRISSNLFYPASRLMSRAPRAWWLCTEVVRFDFVLALSGAPAGAPSTPAPPLSHPRLISRGFLKIEWAAGRGERLT